jgi:predicted nucleic acid-binding Zn ribbon protein
MQSLQNILKTFIKDHGLESGIVLTSIRRQWTNLVGETVAAHTFPDTMRDRVLQLIVDTPQWMHHLSFFREEITAKLKHYDVSEIRFRTGRLPEQGKKDRKAEPAELSSDDVRYIENTLKNLHDEELREKFRALIVHGLTKGKK